MKNIQIALRRNTGSNSLFGIVAGVCSHLAGKPVTKNARPFESGHLCHRACAEYIKRNPASRAFWLLPAHAKALNSRFGLFHSLVISSAGTTLVDTFSKELHPELPTDEVPKTGEFVPHKREYHFLHFDMKHEAMPIEAEVLTIAHAFRSKDLIRLSASSNFDQDFEAFVEGDLSHLFRR